ncbi:MAG: PPC domain-containing protein [Phycisphaerales bacterium]
MPRTAISPDNPPTDHRPARPGAGLLALVAMILTVALTATQASAQYMVRSGQILWMSNTIGHVQYLRINVPAGTAALEVSLNGPNGDADLFLRYGSPPQTSFPFPPDQQQSRSGDSNENLKVINPEPGIWYLAVHAYRGYSSCRFRATLRLSNGQNMWVQGHSGSQQFFSFYVPPNTPRVTFRVSPHYSPSGDPDIFVRRGALPVLRYGFYTWASRNGSGQQDTIEIDNPLPGTYYVLLVGYTAIENHKWLLSACTTNVNEPLGMEVTPKFFRTPQGYDLYLRFTNHSDHPIQIFDIFNLTINGQPYSFDLPIQPYIDPGQTKGYRAFLPPGTFVGFAGGTANVTVVNGFYDVSAYRAVTIVNEPVYLP